MQFHTIDELIALSFTHAQPTVYGTTKMTWQRILSRLTKKNQSTRRNKVKRRGLRLESMEKRQLMASDLGVIAGTTFVDQDLDGSPVGDPPVLVDNSGNLVSPGTAGAQGVQIQLFSDTNNDDIFDNNDLLVGTVTSQIDGSYRFDQLSPGTYFVVQADVPQLSVPGATLVEVTNDAGIRTALIDDYTDGAQSIQANAGATVTDSATGLTNVIGGGRDIRAVNTSGTAIQVIADTTSGTLIMGSTGNAVGTAFVQYDGNDNDITLDATGLNGASLAGGAAGEAIDPDAGLIVRTTSEQAGAQLVITIYSTGGNTSTTTIAVPPGDAAFSETFVRFSAFTGSADFNDVGAIEASLALSSNNDVAIEIAEAITPEIVVTNLANIQTVTLGGQLFVDNSDVGQNNGVREGTEAGITGVTVQLYELAGPNDVVDPANQTPIATTTSGANGTYSFPDLIPGHYATVIPASQFTTGAALFGFANSTGNDPASDPDDNVDSDDNGTINNDGDVISGTITLASNSEPINDDDTDPNTNTTVDFGFFPQINLAITKTLNDAASSVVSGGNAVFDIVVQNAGPLAATNVVVTDVFPAGLTFTGIANASGNFTQSVNGTTATISLGTIPVGTTATFQLTSDILVGQTNDITNTISVATADQVETDLSDNDDDEVLDLISTDLVIVKTDVTDPVNAGETIEYDLVVTNNGPDDASGVVIRDTLPAGVTFASGNVNGAANLVTVDAGTGDIIATIGTLANGASATARIVVNVDGDAGSTVRNNATVTADPNTDPNPDNNTTFEDTDINRSVDVLVTKTVTGNATAGGVVTYRVLVDNDGPSQARGVTVTDTLAADLTLVNGSFDPGTTGVTLNQSGQTLTFDVGDLDRDESFFFEFDVLIDAGATGTIDNTAVIATTDTDTVPENNTSTVPITVGRVVDLILTKTVDLSTAVPGQDQLVYTFTVSHDTDSVSDAVDVIVTDVLPANVVNPVITAATADSQNFDTGTNTITVGFDSLPVGETRTFTVTVDVPQAATGTVVNPASVTSTATELDDTNNSDSATTTLTPVFDVVVDKTLTSGSTTPAIGSTVTYNVNVLNEGPSTATNVILTDAVPAGLTFSSGTFNGVNGVLSGSNVTFPGVILNSGQSMNATLSFVVADTANGTIVNTASVPDMTAAGEDDITNNSDTVTITVTPQAELTISKTVDAANAQSGGTLTYTVRVDNAGPAAAAGVVVTDTLPAGVTFTAVTDLNGQALTGASAASGVVTVNAGTIADDGFFTFLIEATINTGASGTLVNTASVVTTTSEVNPNNNSATAQTVVDPVTSRIEGTVYLDANGNGIQDNGETGIANVTLNLTGTDSLGNNVTRTVNTDAAGDYVFAQLAAGTYQVTEIQPAGFRDGQLDPGNNATAVIGTNVFSNLALAANTIADEFDFGELAASVSKRRFLASARSATETS
ncbi:SpaA isopeptide-forming pilin-related protein [Rubripirellula amarantea]|nr:SpaA isopeptide-forming pilin-related protein [Rubripirellula amarantea]